MFGFALPRLLIVVASVFMCGAAQAATITVEIKGAVTLSANGARPIVLALDDIDPNMTAGGPDSLLGSLKQAENRANTIEGRGDSYLQNPILSSWAVSRRDFYYASWSGDYSNTNEEIGTVKQILTQLIELSTSRGQPLVVVGHSWGSVLAYRAILELGEEEKIGPNSIAALVTIGSPLNSQDSNPALPVKNYGRWQGPEVIKEYVANWRNYWIKKDKISGSINSEEATRYRFFNSHSAYFNNSGIWRTISNQLNADIAQFQAGSEKPNANIQAASQSAGISTTEAGLDNSTETPVASGDG